MNHHQQEMSNRAAQREEPTAMTEKYRSIDSPKRITIVSSSHIMKPISSPPPLLSIHPYDMDHLTLPLNNKRRSIIVKHVGVGRLISKMEHIDNNNQQEKGATKEEKNKQEFVKPKLIRRSGGIVTARSRLVQ